MVVNMTDFPHFLLKNVTDKMFRLDFCLKFFDNFLNIYFLPLNELDIGGYYEKSEDCPFEICVNKNMPI